MPLTNYPLPPREKTDIRHRREGYEERRFKSTERKGASARSGTSLSMSLTKERLDVAGNTWNEPDTLKGPATQHLLDLSYILTSVITCPRPHRFLPQHTLLSNVLSK